MTVDALVARWEAVIAEHRSALLRERLAPPRDEELDGFASRIGLQLPGPVRTLLRWTCGVARDASRAAWIDNWCPSSLADIERHWIVQQRLHRLWPQHTSRPPWHRDWLPFMDNGGGDALCLDLAGACGRAGQLLVVRNDELDVFEGPADLATWLEMVIAAWEREPRDPWLPESTFQRTSCRPARSTPIQTAARPLASRQPRGLRGLQAPACLALVLDLASHRARP